MPHSVYRYIVEKTRGVCARVTQVVRAHCLLPSVTLTYIYVNLIRQRSSDCPNILHLGLICWWWRMSRISIRHSASMADYAISG